jgi:hypothetical protein
VSASTIDEYAEAAANLTPAAVSQFLAIHDWEIETETPQVRLPLARDFADFTQRFRDTLFSIGHVHELDPAQLYERVVATRADLFFVRLDQSMIDGTIPFSQAEQSLRALQRMMTAAATTAADPHHSHRGRRPAGVNEFLDEDVRLAHTKRGSFVFTVVTRLGDAPAVQGEGQRQDPVTPFPRRVMETLARGLQTAERLTRERDTGIPQDPASEGLSAGLVESLEELTRPAQLRQLDLSFEWAAAEPRPNVGLATIVFDRDVIPGLARVKERLVRREEPARRVSLIGTVKTLSRDDAFDGDDETATVSLAADVDGKQRTVHATLSNEDHEWAIVAYQQKIPLNITGNLVFERNAWRLTGAEVDSTFLQTVMERRRGDADRG